MASRLPVVAAIGVELEGGYTNARHEKLVMLSQKIPHLKVGTDGSIEVPDRFVDAEIRLGPLAPNILLSKLKDYYPSIGNKSCGLHVHMSFMEEDYYNLLMDKRLWIDYIYPRMREFGIDCGIPKNHPFWARLNGRNQYCKDHWQPEIANKNLKLYGYNQEYWLRNADRYARVNFRSTYEHKTVEFRFLPYFENPSLAKAAIKELVDIVESFIRENRKKA